MSEIETKEVAEQPVRSTGALQANRASATDACNAAEDQPMIDGAKLRRLSNVKLTRKHHYSFMGLWIVVTSVMILTLNLVMYLYAEERWGGLFSWDSSFHEVYISNRVTFVTALGIEALLFIIGLVALAKFTAHRIAGPYIGMRKTFAAIRNGNMDTRMRFRNYDKLDEMADEFNEMMDAIRDRMAEKSSDG